MRSFKVAITAASKSLFELVGEDYSVCNEILIQAPDDNSEKIYFGERGREYAFLYNGGSSGLNVQSLKNVYVKGTPPDELIIIIM